MFVVEALRRKCKLQSGAFAIVCFLTAAASLQPGFLLGSASSGRGKDDLGGDSAANCDPATLCTQVCFLCADA